MSFTKKLFILALILAVISSEVEARRKILRGRKTITRTYYRGLEIPGWVTVILWSIGIIVVNSIIYLGLNKWIIQRNEPQPAVQYRMEHEV
ncbi:uncharacterized protein hoka [Planococcus citri]|uniref:uncharacterized protein hoka n=1 Tax=Planococcus citri TaxID=170843 RepID=UPI0031F87555